MTARIIEGLPVAERIRAEVTAEVAQLRAKHGLQPGLAVVLVGDDPASQVYVKSKGEQSKAAGMHCIAVAGTLPPERLAEADSIVPGIGESLIRSLLD